MKGENLVEVIKVTTSSGEEFYCLSDLLKAFKADFNKIEKLLMKENEYNLLSSNSKIWRLQE